MLKKYSIASARDKFAALIHQVEHEAGVELTRRGKTVAVILSVQEYRQLQADKRGFWTAYENFQSRFDLAELDIEPEIFAGVRDKTPGRDVQL